MELRGHWPKVPLGKLAEFRNGVNYNKSNFGNGIKVIGVSDFQDHVRASFDHLEQINPEGVVREEHLLRDDDILFVRSNGNRELIGRSLFVSGVRENVTHSAFSIRLRFTSSQCCPRFYAYLFRSVLIRKALSMCGGGTNISNLNQGILERLDVPLPSKLTQERIASILSSYDDLIENNTRRIKMLEEMAQMIYREWFVNFRFPGHEHVRMVESELGPIPEGWRAQTLGDLAAITMGQSPPSEAYNSIGTGLPFHQGVTDFGARFPTDRTYCTVENRLAEPHDILMSVRAPVGRLNISTKKIVIGRGLCAIRSKQDRQAVLFQQLKEHFREEDTMGSGTIFKSVTKQDVHGIKFISGTDSIAAELEASLQPLFRQLECLSSTNINLHTTRDFLLPKLISGEVPVEAADKVAPLIEQIA
jgi:type I restriction enzyme S subunit